MNELYSNLKFLQFPRQIEALRSGDVAAPVHVRIKPINRCNHNCWYCAYRFDDLKLGEDMVEEDVIAEDKIFEIVDDIVAMGVKAVTFSGGGEPLLYRPLPTVVEKLAAGGVRVAALTNGVNLKARNADAFARYGTWIRVSIDAWDNASYQASRGAREGEFDAVIENMKLFAMRETDCVIGVSFIIDETNCQHVYDVCRLFKDIGVNHVKLSGAVVANDPLTVNAYHSKFKSKVHDQIFRAKQLSDEHFTVLDHYHDIEERFDKDYKSCPFLQFLTVIGADCKVYTCQDKAYSEAGILGSIADRSFREFWFSEENRRMLLRLDPSKQCGHHCVAHKKNLSLLEYLSIDQDHGHFV